MKKPEVGDWVLYHKEWTKGKEQRLAVIDEVVTVRGFKMYRTADDGYMLVDAHILEVRPKGTKEGAGAVPPPVD